MKTLILLLTLFILVSCQPSSSSAGSVASAETESSFLKGGESRLIKPPLRNNTAPVVAAGTDITVTDADKNGSEVIHLNGYATDAENNVVTCQLYRNGVLVIAGGDDSVFRTPQTLSVGSYEFLMKATDSKGLHSSDTVVVTVNAAPVTPPVIVVNSAPVVNAGPDFTVTDADNNGSESVKLAGSATDADNNITTYVVAVDGFSVLNGSTAATLTSSITLKVGTHTIAMAATDSGGLKGTDIVIITVKAPAVTNTAPVVNAGADIVVTDQDKNGSEMINLAGSASDAQNNITAYRIYQNGTMIFSGPSSSIFMQSLNLVVGSHVIKLEAVDAGGLMGSDSLSVTVNPGPTTMPTGSPPMANAGPDMTIANTQPTLGIMTKSVIGSAAAGSNPIVSYVWKLNGVPYLKSSSSSILTTNSINFPKGNNLLELEVTDSVGLVGRDTAIVEVKPGLTDDSWLGRNIVPGVLSISAGGDKVLVDNNGDGMESIRMVGSITSVNPIATITWSSRGKTLATGSSASLLTSTFTFPLGRNGVVLTVTDTKGISITDSFTVDVGKPVIEQKARIASNFDVNQYLVADGPVSSSMWKDESAFRFRCKPDHVSYDDPIVFPNQPGKAHMHLFFGNKMANASSTYDSLRASGDGSCDGGPANRSAYWMPTMIDGNGQVVLPDWITIYYKRHPGSTRIPRGLKMVFGYDSRFPQNGHGGKFYCDGASGEGPLISSVPNCPATNSANFGLLYARITSQNCWDGVNLDSPDHRSHMAACSYASGWGVCECPATHPVDIPAFTLLAAFNHKGPTDYMNWRLSSDHANINDPTSTPLPGGTTLHADWFGAWDDSVMDRWMDGCINQFLSCSGGQLGLGVRLKENPDFTWTTVPNRVNAPVKPMP